MSRSTKPHCAACRKALAGPYFHRPNGDFCAGCYEDASMNPVPAPPPSLSATPGPPMERTCKRCELDDNSRGKRADGLKHVPTEPTPTISELGKWTLDSVCNATDGCEVEPDGYCVHGHASWLLYLGFV